MTPISILDLATIGEGNSVAHALTMARETAIAAETLGYNRYWLAEHHGMRGVASSATAVLLANIGAATNTIRIGSGGVMLPNHAPLVIAEQFGTLAELYPNRVDLGLGRAPGTDQQTAQALRRYHQAVEQYPKDIRELQYYLGEQQGPVIAVPGQGTHVPLWLLGSSLYSAQLSASFGLPYAFASHFAPDQLLDALQIYKRTFTPSEQREQPYSMAGIMVVLADTQKEADYLFTSVQQKFLHMRSGGNSPFPAPIDSMDSLWSPAQKQMVNHTLQYALVGTKDSVKSNLTQFLQTTGIDELIVSFPIHDNSARLHAIKLMAELRDTL